MVCRRNGEYSGATLCGLGERLRGRESLRKRRDGRFMKGLECSADKGKLHLEDDQKPDIVKPGNRRN